MGMDVYGRDAKSEKGKYFRNNVWWWHPLWDYCLSQYPTVTQGCKQGHTNDGDGLSAGNSKKLAKLIKRDLENGRAQKYADAYMDKDKYPFSIDNLKEWQEFLDNCGGFNIY